MLAVLIRRHLGLRPELRTRPSSPRGASGPLAGHCTPKLNLQQGRLQDCSGSVRSAKSPPLGTWTKSAEPRALAPVADSHLGSCGCINVIVQRPCLLISVTEAEHRSHHVGAKRPAAGTQKSGKSNISDQGVHTAAKRCKRAPQRLRCAPSLQETPTPR